jgi:hypothetical protein
MEKKSSSMFIPALTYAGIIVGVIIVHTIIIDILGLYFSTYSQIAGFAIPLGGIAFAIYGYRKEYNNNIISYQKALGFGVFVAVLIGLATSAFSIIYSHYINPELLTIGKQMAEEKLINRGMSDEMIEQAMKTQEKFQAPVWALTMGTLFMTLIGTIFSLIAAAFLKKEPEHPFTESE